MNSITNFFQKFLKLEFDKNAKISAIIGAVKQFTRVEIKPEMVVLSGDRIKLQCSAVMRNEIFMHQSEIEESLKSQKIFFRIY